jgi:exodeoxyribonuclease V gamma subunit
MTWQIMGLLPALCKSSGFERLSSYLGDGNSQVKRLQLAERIAHTFDQYLTFRPEMILRWEEGQGNHWQAVLWRKLAQGKDQGHRANLGKAFLKAVSESTGYIEGLPERISVFGISALPPFHMEMLAGVSQLVQVNLFLMNPCQEYWGDIVSDWEAKRVVDRELSQDITIDTLHLEKGNSLLASMGTVGRGFFDLVNTFPCEETTLFEEPNGDDLLSCLQSDILNMRNRQGSGAGKHQLAKGDDSVQIHACHSPMREMEVLNDQLLHMFEQDIDLMPEDVLVMTPDIETYAPYIQAVFDVPLDESCRFPFTLADRSIRKEGPVVDVFLSILALYGSRFQASQVMAVLESKAVYEKFGLIEADLEIIRVWIAETGIRWGIDAQSRGKLGLPPFPQNSWEAGLERLLLGYAMAGHGEVMFREILPYDHVEGRDALILGRFVGFVRALFSQVTGLDQPRPLARWSMTLEEIIDAFFQVDEDNTREIQALRVLVKSLGTVADRAYYDEDIHISIVAGYLARRLEKEGFGSGFMSGGITFCAMLPMRSIPFKVICLVGMNGDAYPRESRPLGFDLMAKHPRPGDRSRRYDDRYLFLEAVLSARKKLYLSYVGQSTQDNSPLPPSVLVSELTDYIEQGFTISGQNVLPYLLTRHGLQPFSAKYFNQDETLFSYSHTDMEAARAAMGAGDPWRPFVSESLPPPEDTWKTLTLNDLCRFLKGPSKYFMNRRFGMYFEVGAAILEDSESFNLQGLDKYFLEQELVKRRFSEKSLKGFDGFLKASGRIPHGAVGACLYENMCFDVDRFVEKTTPYLDTVYPEPLDVALSLGPFEITGTIDGCSPERLVQYRYATVKSKDRLSLWIRHLVLNCIAPKDHPMMSTLIGLNNQGGEHRWVSWEYGPVQGAKSHLEDILKVYWAGLCKPVPLFPESSWTYAHALLEQGKSKEQAHQVATKVWAGDDFHRGEGDDPYYQSCFDIQEALDDRFTDMAIQIFRPLITSQKRIAR